MSRFLALEWDAAELRGVAARRQGNEVVLEKTWALELPRAADGATTDAVTAALAKIVADLGTARLETLIAVGRANIELKVLQAPSAPPDELPDLVRFQALRQFSTLGENWPLDFIQQADRGEEGLTVLAAALSPESLQQLKAPCEKAGLTVRVVALRPFAAAAVVRQRASTAAGVLLVDQLGDEADLTVIAGGQVLLPRTVRLRADEANTAVGPLAAEIRRTMLSATNQLGGKRFEEVILFGDRATLAASAEKLGEELKLQVSVCNPFDGIAADDSVKLGGPRPGRFAPLIGLLLDVTKDRRPEIDFLNPRRRPIPPDRRRLYGLIAATALAVIALPLVAMWLQLSALDGEIDSLTKEKARLIADVKGLADERQAVAVLDEFERGSVPWIEELRWLSEKLPPADKVITNELLATYLQEGGGRITIQATADASTTVAEMEPGLRDAQHVVAGSGAQYDARTPKQPWRFRKTITVVNEDAEPAPRGGASR